MKNIIAFAAIILLLSSLCKTQEMDHSPYCDSLARITKLCSEWFIHKICPKTCKIEHVLTKTCGIGADPSTPVSFAEKRKKRFDGEERNNDEILEEQRQGMINRRVRRVVGGNVAVKGGFPWHVALYYDGEQTCNGVLLSADWVVTTAHCFNVLHGTSNDPSRWEVVAGQHKMPTTPQSSTTEISKVKTIVVHEMYHSAGHVSGEKSQPDDYDIALLKLDRSLPINSVISPICLSDDLTRFTNRDDCRVMGWGSSNAKGWFQKTLQEAKVKIVPHDICNLPISYNGTIHKRAICAGYSKGADACDSDSGGSLACNKNQRWYGVGLISFGYSCGTPKSYGVFTNMPMMKSWIIQTILCYDDKANSIVSVLERISSLIPHSAMQQ